MKYFLINLIWISILLSSVSYANETVCTLKYKKDIEDGKKKALKSHLMECKLLPSSATIENYDYNYLQYALSPISLECIAENYGIANNRLLYKAVDHWDWAASRGNKLAQEKLGEVFLKKPKFVRTVLSLNIPKYNKEYFENYEAVFKSRKNHKLIIKSNEAAVTGSKIPNTNSLKKFRYNRMYQYERNCVEALTRDQENVIKLQNELVDKYNASLKTGPEELTAYLNILYENTQYTNGPIIHIIGYRKETNEEKEKREYDHIQYNKMLDGK